MRGENLLHSKLIEYFILQAWLLTELHYDRGKMCECNRMIFSQMS